jgi:hypothetical protein
LILIARHFPHDWIWRYGRAVIVAQLLWGLLSMRHGALFAWLAGKAEGLRDFQMLRRYGNPGVLEPLLNESEATIKQLQQRNGADWYWRWYFRLT